MTNIESRLKKAERQLGSNSFSKEEVIEACIQFYKTDQFPEGFEFPSAYSLSDRAAAFINAHSRLDNEDKGWRLHKRKNADIITPTPSSKVTND
jgi:hypothetical protein